MVSSDPENSGSASDSSTDTKNAGAQVTRSQQVKILLSTSLASFTVVGLTQAFGVFQAHYTRMDAVDDGIVHLDHIDDRAVVAAIGSLGNGGIVAVFAVLYYPHLPRLGTYVRILCWIGTACIVAGFATATASRSVWHLFASQGILVGIGSGILLYVLSPILPEYFPKRSGLAQGTMFAAAALGGMVFSFMITSLLDHVRARWTLGIVAIFSCVTLSIASAVALPPRKFEKRGTSIIGLRTFKEPLFACLFLANLIHPLTLAIPMTFGPLFAESLGMNFTHASYMLAVNSGVGIPARLGVGALADKIGHQNTLILATAVYALATWVFWLTAAEAGNVGLWISMSVFHGLVNGVFNIVMNSAQKQLFGDEMYYPKNGAMTSIRGVGYVVGVPIAGALMGSVAGKDLHGSDFTKVIVYVGSLLMISLVCLLNVRRLDAKQTGWKWAR